MDHCRCCLESQRRFWSQVDQSSDCWIWTGRLFHGYGMYRHGGRDYRAHRLAYEWMVGPIPQGLVIDHLCRVRECVNPAHLEPVTNSENTLRALALRNFGVTHCLRGHEYTEENTYRNRNGTRQCRACWSVRRRIRSGKADQA